MKKLLLIIGIVSVIFCVLFLLFAILNLFGYYHVLDGSAYFYDRLYHRMIIYFVIGIVFAVIGILFLTIRSKI